MEYPRNGSIVIVDDKPEEIEGLIRVLASKSIPTMYFNEDIEKIPSINGIRIIFLDLDLKIGVQDNSERAIISTAFAVLNKLIVENNGGYVLALWSTLIENHGETVKQKILDAKKRNVPLIKEYPIEIILLNKNEVSTKSGQVLNFNIEAIKEKINSIIPDNNILNLINYWENSVSDASKRVMSNFDTIAQSDSEKKTFYALFADSISQTKYLEANNIIAPAFAPISNLLADQLSINNTTIDLQEIGGELVRILSSKPKIDTNSVSKINTFYHLDNDISCNNAPGTVYNYNSFMKNSCSSNECSTMWAEGLEEKIKLKITSEITEKSFEEKFDKNYKDLKDKVKTLTKRKSFLWNVEDVFDKEYDESIFSQIKDIYPDFNIDNQQASITGLKKYIQFLNQEIRDSIIKKQIKLVFGAEVNDQIKATVSQDKDYDDLNFDEKIMSLRRYYSKNEMNQIKESFEQSSIPIFLEFSPDCDFVQVKRKKLRLVFGLLYPYDEYTAGEKVFNGDYYVYTPIIEYKGQPFRMVFDLHTVTGINENILHRDVNILFRLRKELLVDIQQKIATHISRPGFFNMNDYLK